MFPCCDAADTFRDRHATPEIDKTGDWSKWYPDNVPAADDLFDRHPEQTTEKKKQKKRAEGKETPGPLTPVLAFAFASG